MTLDWPCLAARGEGSVLMAAVVPGARRTGADGLHDGCLRVRLVARPVEGQANDALLAWLARELHLPRRGVTLLRGDSARRKQIAVAAPPQAVADWLEQVLGGEAQARA
jgi:uncharacterized protein YggU (UPF0235/DUF167 family)